MTVDIPAFFERYEWSCEAVDEAIWRTSFATEHDEDFDIYVARSHEWIHFAVSPFTPPPRQECQAQLYNTLLHLNQQLRLVRFAVDEDGDVNLLADLPATNFDYSLFAATMDSLVHYTQQLSRKLARAATEVGYHSPVFTTGRQREG
jgi:hypothetical protein